MNNPQFFIRNGLVVSGLLLMLCVLIRPHGLSANDGLSYFGGLEATIVPYSAAFLAYAFASWKASEELGDKQPQERLLGTALRIQAILLCGLVVTPHTLVNGIHTAIGATLFSFQLLLTAWFYGQYQRDWQNMLLLVAELLSGLASFYYLPATGGLLLQTQVVFQFAFGVFLIRALGAVASGD